MRRRLPLETSVERAEFYGERRGKTSLLPLFLSTAGWALLWNLPAYGNLSLAAESMQFSAAATRSVDLWISACPAGGCDMAAAPHPFAALLRQAADAMGHAPPLPFFATGFIQVRPWQQRGSVPHPPALPQLLSAPARSPVAVLPAQHSWIDGSCWLCGGGPYGSASRSAASGPPAPPGQARALWSRMAA